MQHHFRFALPHNNAKSSHLPRNYFSPSSQPPPHLLLLGSGLFYESTEKQIFPVLVHTMYLVLGFEVKVLTPPTAPTLMLLFHTFMPQLTQQTICRGQIVTHD